MRGTAGMEALWSRSLEASGADGSNAWFSGMWCTASGPTHIPGHLGEGTMLVHQESFKAPLGQEHGLASSRLRARLRAMGQGPGSGSGSGSRRCASIGGDLPYGIGIHSGLGP